MKLELIVSVPSRGILFPNLLMVRHWMASTKFPSPLGVSYFQIQFNEDITNCRNAVSVPSRGILFPNIANIKSNELTLEEGFPSPLGVSYFQMSV